ncbi:aminoacyl-tRNA hydrolase [Sulfolobus sp. A20]|uniref:peptidyl-tRNA hydrolase Pth2 n=1 Tax=Saccharolobus sp. A20 TaxID=1891280 RepID=UPI000845FEC1|nr:peptidyl-tRNA hydrolase Pth2 [Sulfolobus sp. A20]TRM76043.1 aminoacyl-tRNA hydrolase [Sulfolobus sp. B5]TRM77810.1 aminoacyl-tRNA hydrolase [Sulfolobus sp. A20-N-F8]TRM87671.1 aminoacyl-tRNA hydrolase [Sulfolobus sp. E3]TRM98993.1 aminoacyl-tRNA hydrolase [Sulfolobus sp. F1]TRN01844.1 aminoacyl-tRNA hydrolase [Sulfolobus sp. E1]
MAKMVIVVRNDIKMGKGKIAAQVAHAAVTLVLNILNSNNERWKDWLNSWLDQGQPKIVVKVESLNDLMEKFKKAKEYMLPATVIQDAGKTQLEPGTITCLGIGPAPDDIIDLITGDLKLL